MKVKGMGRRNIGAIMNNNIKDVEFAQRALQFNIDVRNMGKAGKPKTKEELEQRIDDYFVLSQQYALPATVEGLAMAIDYDRRSLYDLETGRGRVDFSDTIKRAKDFICSYDAVLAQSNKLNAAIYCFRSKNMYGMKDVQEIQAIPAYSTDPENAEDFIKSLPTLDEKTIEIKDE